MGVFEGGDAVDARPLLGEWPELRAALKLVKRLHDRAPVGGIGRLGFLMLRPNDADKWNEPLTGWYRVELPLRTNPGCMMYAGVESAHLPVGHLTLVNQGVWTSAVNFGETPRVHLAVDFRVKPTNDG